ncbi:MAG: bifunctional 3-demethylubiquinol 3-O-methyltransferase/2-polyprenyl-6-hydroxyphenol methylase, partial [Hyphomicrobiales bacterium]|nr:bifunctional 3-demethylubiquinol 3-O-methyltransferase/2-polyprenyl-6-hydroxyphenol methylase [Hyphomicrobiales bacterium]
KSFLLAIVGAEYVLGWLPKGTHRWDKFLTPQEIENMLVRAGMKTLMQTGVTYAPLRGVWSLSKDTDVNYMVCARKI